MFIVERIDFSVFLVRAFFLGVLFASGYLLLGFERILFANKNRLIFQIIQLIFDLFYCILICFCDILMIYCANRGQIRIIALIIQLSGFLLIYLPLSKPVKRWEEKLMRAGYRKLWLPITEGIKRKKRKRALLKYNQKIDAHLEKDIVSLLKAAEEHIFDR